MYDDLIRKLRATEIPFAESGWDKAPAGDYGVYGLDMPGDTIWADGHMAERAMQGSIDLFARHGPGRDKARQIEDALDGLGINWFLNSVQYESDRRITHWEWVFELEAM